MAVSAANPGLDWGWHLDRDCPALAALLNATHLANPQSLVRELAAPTALALAHAQDAAGHAPCPRCAYGPVLAQLGERVRPDGYHVLVCGSHPVGLAYPCAVCHALSGHAQAGGIYLSARAGARTALLGPGAVPLAHRPLLARMRVVSQNARPGGLTAVSAAHWTAAAALYVPGAGLGRVLAAAAGLYAEPQASSVSRRAPSPGASIQGVQR